VSHLKDAASWIWPGGVCWHRFLASLAVKTSKTQKSVPMASAHDAEIRSWRFVAGVPDEKRRKTTRRY
jgi:hypothetical protein